MTAPLTLVGFPWQVVWGRLQDLMGFFGLPHLQDPLWLAAWGQFFTLLVTASGLIFVYLQLRSLAREHKLATNAATSQLYAEVSVAMDRVSRVFNERPALIPYLYENKPAPPVDRAPSVRRRLDNVCESVLDMVDAVVEQRRSLPADVSMDWSTWDAYFRYMFANSPVLQEFVDDNADFYPDYLFAALGRIVVRDTATGRVLSRWNVRELAPDDAADAESLGVGPVSAVIDPASLPEPGFPFLRTWLIERKQSARATEPAAAALVAAVEGVSPVEAKVTMRWLAAPGHDAVRVRELEVLQHWIVGTMHGTGIKQIAFDLPTGRRSFAFRKPTVPNGTRSFLVPEYPIRDRPSRQRLRRSLRAARPDQPKGAGAPGAAF